MLLSNYIKLILIAGIISFYFTACADKEEPADNQFVLDMNNPESVLQAAQNAIPDSVSFGIPGQFDADTLKDAAAGTEIINSDVWGIKFYLLKAEEGKLVKKYETALLDGSFTEGLVEPVRLPDYQYDFVYYNSQDYYLGSGGGEVFSYLVDLNLKQTYYAHLFIEREAPVSLFLSENAAGQVKEFFVTNFKKDYPRLKLVTKDVDLNY